MSLQGRLELLGDELTGPAPDLDDSRRQLADARAQADRLSQLAADLLDLSRLDAGIELRREPVEMAELVRAVAAEFTTRADRRETQIDLDVEPVNAEADPTATARVLRIVLDNAMRVSPRGRAIGVAVTRDDGWVHMTVTDHGTGIAQEDRDRIFQRFVRGVHADQPGGFGLGLAIGRELSERMGGRLELERTGADGSVFGLRLPPAPNGIPT
jgi:signal transduction histidine kinase